MLALVVVVVAASLRYCGVIIVVLWLGGRVYGVDFVVIAVCIGMAVILLVGLLLVLTLFAM